MPSFPPRVSRPIRFYLIMIVPLALLLLVGFVWQIVAGPEEARSSPPPGRLVEVDGHTMHLYCTGQGSPTVILEGGVPEWSVHWQLVQPEMAKSVRVCSYDRAGYGWSEPEPQPRTVGQIVDELHGLLAAAGERPPFILVAHSLWGPAPLLYHQRYPGEVAGIVLVDAWGPELFSPMPDAIRSSLPLADGLTVLSSIGQVRLLNEIGILPLEEMLHAQSLPDAQRRAFRAAAYRPETWATMRAEYQSMEASAAELSGLGNLGDLPLVVIQAGIRLPDDYPTDAVWDETQQLLAQRSTSGKWLLAEESGHFVQLEAPRLVIDAILSLVRE